MVALVRCLVGTVLPLGAVAASLSAQNPSTPKLPVTPLDPSRTTILTVDPPAALSRDELARRLQKLDATLPDVLPSGASVVLTPERLRNGRTQLEILGADYVGFDSRGRSLAIYQENQPVGFTLTFDAPAASRFALDCTLLAVSRSSIGTLGGTFYISTSGLEAASVAPTPGGHLLHLVDAPRAGRYVVKVFRNPGPAREVGSPGFQWRLYAVELLRVR